MNSIQNASYLDAELRKRIVAILSAASGNFVEWFDFYIYAFCAIYFAPTFFPHSSPTAQLLNTAGVFAMGFLMRPIGGWLFGRLADRHGRKKSMVTSVIIMCVGSLIIACLPGYETIGMLAPVLLLLARLLQGLSVGGEYGTTATYMSEAAIAGKRGFLSSFQYVTLIGGQLMAVLVVVILQHLLGEQALKAWAWRIPFVLGAFTALVALWLRRSLTETANINAKKDKNAGSLRILLRDHKAAFFIVLGFTAGGSLSFYTFTTYMQKYLVNSLQMPIDTASTIMTVSLLIYMLVQPLFGALSDRIGRRNNMLLFGGLGTLLTLPLFGALQQVTSPFIAFCLILMAMGFISFYTAIAGIVKAELFPVEVRALGVGLSYAIANAVFGGTAEFFALGLKTAGYEHLFYWYVTLMLAISFLTSLRLPRRPVHLSHYATGSK